MASGAGGSPSDKAIKIVAVAAVTAVAAYLGYRAYKKQYPFEELFSKKGKSAEDSSTKREEAPIENEIVTEPVLVQKASSEDMKSDPGVLASIARTKGNEFYARNDYQQAVNLYTEAINLYPKDDKDLALAYANRAACYLKMSRFSAVIDDCNKALEITPDSVKVLDRRSRAYEQLGRLEDALVDASATCIIDDFKTEGYVRHVEKVLNTLSKDLADAKFSDEMTRFPSEALIEEFFSTFPGEWDNLHFESESFNGAIEALKAKQFLKAAELSVKAVEECKDNLSKAKALNLKASFELIKGNVAACEASLEESIKLNDQDANTWLKMALVTLEYNDFSNMTKALETSSTLKEDNPALFYHRAEILALSGSLDSAVNDFVSAEKLYPAFEICYVHHARALLGLNRFDEAERLLQKAAKRFPTSVEVQNGLGEVLFCRKDYAGADAKFDEILAKHPKSPQVYLNKALLAVSNGADYKNAEKNLLKAVEINPDFEAPYLQLANLKLSQGLAEETMKHYDDAIAHARTHQDLVSIYSLKCSSVAQIRIMKQFPFLESKLKALMQGQSVMA